jgi:hypothetical protein
LTLVLKTVFASMLLTTSMNLVGADEYRALDRIQTTNLRTAAKIGSVDGHDRYLMPAVIYQESKAGLDKKHQTFIGIGQVGFAAVREVLQEYPEVSSSCGGINHKSPKNVIRRAVQENDRCGITVASKYMVVIKEKYGISGEEHQVVAYQRGPIAGKKVKSSQYSKSVMRHKRNLKNLFKE